MAKIKVKKHKRCIRYPSGRIKKCVPVKSHKRKKPKKRSIWRDILGA